MMQWLIRMPAVLFQMNESNIESGAVTLNGQAKTIDELKQATIALAHKIKLSITLPNGRKSRAG